MLIYIVRHAWAEEANAELFPDDDMRPLSAKGSKRFARLVKKLARRGFAPRRIATSPLIRCRQTADIIAARLPETVSIDELAGLAPGSDLEAALAWTRGDAAGGDVAWVGHAPDVGNLAAGLIGPGAAAIEFAKGAVAAILVDDLSHPESGELQWLVTAKLLGC